MAASPRCPGHHQWGWGLWRRLGRTTKGPWPRHTQADRHALAVGAGQGEDVLLVLDRAGWLVNPHVHVPMGPHLHFLPPYSPELRLWHQIRKFWEDEKPYGS
ncbi:MAG TPA: hypothetical protein VNP04_04565 [Alphaproteobacteria bacterium]|nr:hypothetical protein [Alphaproteobacteria bacterium]